jgi:hypothetical protein
MKAYTLYDQLRNMDFIDVDEDDKNKFIETVHKMSDEEHEKIFALIRTHQIQNRESTSSILPYSSKHQKKGLKFDFDQFPSELQSILIHFINNAV